MNPLLGKSWSEAQVRLVKSCAASVVGDDANGEISITPQRLYVDTDAPEPLTLDEENTLLNQMADLIKYGYAARRFTEDVQTFLRGKHQ